MFKVRLIPGALNHNVNNYHHLQIISIEVNKNYILYFDPSQTLAKRGPIK